MKRTTGVIMSYLTIAFEMLSTLLLTPYIISTLGQAEYGVYKLSVAIISYLFLLDLGIGNAVVRYVAKYRALEQEQENRKFLGVVTIYYGAVALLTLIIGAGLVAAFPKAFAVGLSAAEVQLGQKLLIITVLNAAVTLGTAGYTNTIVAFERFTFTKGSSIVQIILKMGFTYLGLRLGYGSVAIVTVQLLLTILFRAANVAYVLWRIKLKPIFQGLDTSLVKEVFVYTSFVFIQMIATQINSFADQVLLGALVPMSSVIIGVYGIGSQVVQYFQSIGSSITGVLMPGIVRLVEQKATGQAICDEMVRIGRIIFLLLSVIVCCFIVFGRQFIHLWAGAENDEAYYVALLLMVIQLLILTISMGSQVLWAKNEHKEQAILKVSFVVLNVFLTIFLIKWNPLIGATIGTFVSLLLGDFVTMSIVYKKKIGISLRYYYGGLFRKLIPCVVLTLICGFLFKQLNLAGWVGFLCNVAVMAAIYVVSMWFYGMNRYEKQLVRSIGRKLLPKRA